VPLQPKRCPFLPGPVLAHCWGHGPINVPDNPRSQPVAAPPSQPTPALEQSGGAADLTLALPLPQNTHLGA